MESSAVPIRVLARCTCAPAELDRDLAPQTYGQKESEAAPLDGLDVLDSSGTSSTSLRALHRDPATARRGLLATATGTAAELQTDCCSTTSCDGLAMALPTAPAGRRRPRSSRESAPVEEGRRRGGVRHAPAACGMGDVTVKGTWWVHRVLIRMSFPGLSHVKEHQKLI